MIHGVLIVIAALGALLIRQGYEVELAAPWNRRWQQALWAFAMPPLLIVITAMAVVWMGQGGMMAAGLGGSLSYGAAVGIMILAGLVLIAALGLGWWSEQQIRQFPQETVDSVPVRVMDSERLWAAQVGWCQPSLALSRATLERLNPSQLKAVMLHEQAHAYFRDPVLFMGLGWLRRLTWFLPRTETLWQELVLLRELRADRWTATHHDGLSLAEALWLFAADGHEALRGVGIGLLDSSGQWEHRLEALLAPPAEDETEHPIVNPCPWWMWMWLLLPLCTIPWHH
ncbi:MAG: M56 family metallopeptidase [Synechococcales cyanobacterium]